MSFIGSRLAWMLLLLLVGIQLAFAERTTTYFHTDSLGSVVAASDQSGAVLWRKSYAPFGEQIDTQPDSERLSYTGKPHDALLGLTNFGARYYDPQLGRFMSPDPVGFSASKPMSFNRYAYANNNPYAYVDPDGRDPERIFGIMMGIVHSKEDALKIQQAELAANNFVAADGVDTGLALVEAKRALDRGEFVDVPVTAVIAVIGVAVTKKSGRLGNAKTRQHVDDVATEMESRGWTITHGGGRGPEEYIPGPGGGRKGSSYPDITATKDGRTLRVNTVDTRADGVTPTTREAKNAGRIRQQTNEHVLLVPKP